MKEVPAEKFNKHPAPIYRAASKGEKVTINHAHYPDQYFYLTAVDKDKDNEN